MLYQHKTHAGNRSDIIKHICLIETLKSRHYNTVWDAFAAQASYPATMLDPQRIQRIQSLCGNRSLHSVDTLCNIIGKDTENLSATDAINYPGSGRIVDELLQVEKLVLSEQDSGCIETLEKYFHQRPGVSVLEMDSFRSAALALQCDPELVFIDPPYIDTDEWYRVEILAEEILALQEVCQLLIWYPVRAGLDIRVERLPGQNITLVEAEFDGEKTALQGCGVIYVNFSTAQLASLPELVCGLEKIPSLELSRVSLRVL